MPAWTPDWNALPEELAAFWAEYHLCSLSTLDKEGGPHAVPVGVALDPEQQCAWIITRGGSQKVRNLRRDPRLAITQVDGGRWATIIGTGEVREDEESVARACEKYAARYRPPGPREDRVAIRVTVEKFLASVLVLPDA